MAQWLNIDFFRNMNLIFIPSNVIPKLHYPSIKDISIEVLKKSNINSCIIDVNQTILAYEQKIIEKEVIKKLIELQTNFDCCILSNYLGSKIDDPAFSRTEDIRDQLSFMKIVETEYKKPSKMAFQIALDELQTKPENCCVIGDRVFTDIVGANIMKMVSILIDPVDSKSDPFFYIAIPRFIERIFLYLFTSFEK